MSSEELPVSIKASVLTEHFSCPICMGIMRDVFMTTCGHHFCEPCIKESIARHHRCPCCNHALSKADLIKANQFQNIINTYQEEKQTAEKQYFDKIIQDATDEVTLAGVNAVQLSPEESAATVTPIENVLRKHLRQSLAAHLKYYQDLYEEYKRAKQFNSTTDPIYTNLSESDNTSTDGPESNVNKSKELQQLELCGTLIAGAYDRYLSDHIPLPSVLPVKLDFRIYSKNLLLPNIEIQPTHTVSDILEILKVELDRVGDKLVSFEEDVNLVYFSVFSKCAPCEMARIARDIVELHGVNTHIFHLPKGTRPVLQFALKPGGEIGVLGTVKLQSDLPKLCFATTFQKDSKPSVDYFTCKDCGFNWVCRSCMESCHKDHETTAYIMNHQPTWACCYCPKKKKCSIEKS